MLGKCNAKTRTETLKKGSCYVLLVNVLPKDWKIGLAAPRNCVFQSRPVPVACFVNNLRRSKVRTCLLHYCNLVAIRLQGYFYSMGTKCCVNRLVCGENCSLWQDDNLPVQIASPKAPVNPLTNVAGSWGGGTTYFACRSTSTMGPPSFFGTVVEQQTARQSERLVMTKGRRRFFGINFTEKWLTYIQIIEVSRNVNRAAFVRHNGFLLTSSPFHNEQAKCYIFSCLGSFLFWYSFLHLRNIFVCTLFSWVL